MFQRAYIQQSGNGKLGHEENLVHTECLRRNIPVTLFAPKLMQRRQVPLGAETFLAGDGHVTSTALKILNLDPRTLDDYPECLHRYLHRRVWRSTLGKMMDHVWEGRKPVFVKPADRRKIFTGRLFEGPDDLYALSSTSRNEPVWCADPVEWRSEFRVYILKDQILSIDHYDGDAALYPDQLKIESAIKTFRESGQAPKAYALDFGMLESGETALVEANDAFSLGAYHIGASDYTDLLFERWAELLSQSPPP
jgi:hypothetical protein